MRRIPQSVAMSACPTRARCSGRARPRIPTETLAYRPRSPWAPSRDHQLWSLPRSGRTRMPWMLRAGRSSRAGRSIRRTAGSRPRHWPTSTGTARPRSSKAGTRQPATPWGSSTPTEATSGFLDRVATCCATTTRTRPSTHRRPWATFSGAVPWESRSVPGPIGQEHLIRTCCSPLTPTATSHGGSIWAATP